MSDVLPMSMSFGKNLLELFSLGEGFVNLNHGSFGATPKMVLLQQKQLIEQQGEI